MGAMFSVNPISANTTTLTTDGYLSIRTKVCNVGDELGTVTIRVLMDGRVMNQVTRTLEPGKCAPIGLNMTGIPVGTHTYCVEAGGSRQCVTVKVVEKTIEAKPVISVDIADIHPDMPTTMDDLNVVVNVSNTGTVGCTIYLYIYVDSKLAESDLVSINPNETKSLEYNIGKLGAGHHEVCVDYKIYG